MRLLVLLFFVFLPFELLAHKPELLLLKTYKDQNISGWVMSEKLDGIRAYWDGEKLLSRNGVLIHAPEWFTKEYPPFAIDGELWSKRGDFENISSIVRQKTPDARWREIKHYIFEVPNASGTLFERLAFVESNSVIKVLKQYPIKSNEHLQEFLKSIEAQGGEGVVVRDPNAAYISKRSDKALKVKNFEDDECEVIGYSEGRGKYEGVVGALECRLENGVEFKVGSGLSDAQRKNPPEIGDLITFKYQGLTKYKKPRFPVFLRLRYKKSQTMLE